MMKENQSSGKQDYDFMWEDFRLSGSNRTLAQIYFDHFDSLFDFGLKYTVDRALIEDSIQNIFGYFLKKRKKLNPVTNLSFYLLQSFRRELFRQIAKKNKLTFTDESFGKQELFCLSDVEEKMDSEEHDEIMRLVQKSVLKLGPRQQEIIYLRFSLELGYSEIAEMLHISVDSCYKSVYRAVKLIKEDIGKTLPNGTALLLFIIKALKKI